MDTTPGRRCPRPYRYDAAAWAQRFPELWPAGCDAHRSYFERLRSGAAFERAA
ncbi:MAG: hypothetical protein OEW90_09485 [Betaproteobacteria bacterium]|nr:hypothetical protein [Betaproteobacteria bacterium]